MTTAGHAGLVQVLWLRSIEQDVRQVIQNKSQHEWVTNEAQVT